LSKKREKILEKCLTSIDEMKELKIHPLIHLLRQLTAPYEWHKILDEIAENFHAISFFLFEDNFTIR
jgi:hypothetical protein